MSRSRQVDVEARAASHLTVAIDPAPVLLDNAEDHGQAQARAPALALGGKERLEDARPDIRWNPQAGVLNAQAHEGTRTRFQVQARVVLIQLHIFRLQKQA